METITKAYEGFVFSYLRVPLMGSMFTVNVASDNPKLFAMLAPDDKVITDYKSIENAITEAKRRIDRILGK